MNVMVSGIATREGRKVAYVMFEDNGRSAEAIIPECSILSNKGFSDKELENLKDYMFENMEQLKRQAMDINPLRALMKESDR